MADSEKKKKKKGEEGNTKIWISQERKEVLFRGYNLVKK